MEIILKVGHQLLTEIYLQQMMPCPAEEDDPDQPVWQQMLLLLWLLIQVLFIKNLEGTEIYINSSVSVCLYVCVYGGARLYYYKSIELFLCTKVLLFTVNVLYCV